MKVAVAKAIVSHNKKKPRLSEPLPVRPAKVEKPRKSLPPPDVADEQDEPAPMPWHKVTISENRLKNFRFQR
jgi:hypothetical protein